MLLRGESMSKIELIVKKLRKIQKEIRCLPIDLRDPEQLDIMRFAVASVDDVDMWLRDLKLIEEQEGIKK